jgi:hypothetical protein
MKFKLKDAVTTVKENQIMDHRQMVTVAVALPVHDTFTYSIPAHLTAQTCPGKRVLVPFGRRMVTGYLIGTGPGGDGAAGYQAHPGCARRQAAVSGDIDPLF